MMFLRRTVLVFVISLIYLQGNTQTFKPSQTKRFRPSSDTLVLDSLSLVPGSVNYQTFPSLDSANQPVVDYKIHALVFKGKRPDSLAVTYKRFPYNFENTF